MHEEVAKTNCKRSREETEQELISHALVFLKEHVGATGSKTENAAAFSNRFLEEFEVTLKEYAANLNLASVDAKCCTETEPVINTDAIVNTEDIRPVIGEALISVTKKRKFTPPLCISKLEKELEEDKKEIDQEECVLESNLCFTNTVEIRNFDDNIKMLSKACEQLSHVSKIMDGYKEKGRQLASAQDTLKCIRKSGAYDFLSSTDISLASSDSGISLEQLLNE